jgi:hypothetical protein
MAELGRNLSQNALLHALCGDVANQKQWAGQKIDCEGWKRLFVDSWARETGRSPGKVVPSLDGESVVVLNISTRKLIKKDFAELITWILAYCDMNDIRLNAPENYLEYREAVNGQ